MNRLPNGYDYAVEFRHVSWRTEGPWEMGAVITADDFKDKVTFPKKRPFDDAKVTKPMMTRILLALKHLPLKTLLLLEKDTQARPAEILGLRVQDFNFSYDPPYLNIPAERAKNDIPRELFFTQETKELVISYIRKNQLQPKDFLFIGQDVNPLDEIQVQKRIDTVERGMGLAFRKLLSQPGFEDLNQVVEKKGRIPRYKIHIYSFKKFAFTAMADILGEVATRAVKGDAEYVFTYYKKTREERAEDYRQVIPKVSIFDTDSKSSREQVQEEMNKMSKEELDGLLDFIRKGNNLSRK